MSLLIKSLNLSDDELDVLREIVYSDGFNIFLKICTKFNADMQQDVINYSLTSLSTEALSELAYRKLRVQGGEKLLQRLKALKEELVKQTKNQ